MSRQSWCMQKMESKALVSEEANATAPGHSPELPRPYCHCSAQTWGIQAAILQEVILLADK